MQHYQCTKTHIGANGETVLKWSLLLLDGDTKPPNEFWEPRGRWCIRQNTNFHWMRSEWVEDGVTRYLYVAPGEEHVDNLLNVRSVWGKMIPENLKADFERTKKDPVFRDLFFYHCDW